MNKNWFFIVFDSNLLYSKPHHDLLLGKLYYWMNHLIYIQNWFIYNLIITPYNNIPYIDISKIRTIITIILNRIFDISISFFFSKKHYCFNLCFIFSILLIQFFNLKRMTNLFFKRFNNWKLKIQKIRKVANLKFKRFRRILQQKSEKWIKLWKKRHRTN